MSVSTDAFGGSAVPERGRPDHPATGELIGAAAAQPAAAPARHARQAPVRAAGVDLLGAVAGSGYRRAPALVRRSDGQMVQLTPLLYALLEAIDGERGHAELAEAVAERTGKAATVDQIRYLVEAKLRPLGLLQRLDGTEPAVAKPNPLLALNLKLVVSNPAVTSRVAAPFAAFFNPVVVAAVTAAFALTAWWVAFDKGLASAARQAIYEPGLLVLVFALTILSAGFHELGHAAACRYSGARPGAMGVGLYLVWPAFYTDVTDSYRLGRGGRLRVDLGGLYFNAIFGVGILLLWTAVRWDALLLVIAAQLLQMARQLIPVVRFDGYHVLADLTGVPDLFAHIKPTLLGLLPSRWGRAGGTTLKPWARAVVTAWVLVVVPLLTTLLVLLVVVLPRIVATAWDSLGLHWRSVEANWAHADAAAVAAGLISMLVITLPAIGVPYLLGRVARRVVRGVWRATSGRPLLRAAAGLAGAGLVAAIAWAWWPADQYRPIEADDRGRLTDAPRLALYEPRLPDPPVVRLLPTASSNAEREPVVRTTVRSGVVPVAAVPVRVSAPTAATPGLPAPPVPPAVLDPIVALEPELPIVLAAPFAEDAAAPVAEPAVIPTAPAPPPTEPTASEWPFPFVPPREPHEGDNQVVVVNTTDGARAFDVALSLAWVTDGGPVEQRNEAWAFAKCTGCRTDAVAFQVVLIVGHVQIITPVNAAVAANYECETCVTQALAVQLVATLSRQPSEQTASAIAAVWDELEALQETMATVPLAEIYTLLLEAREEILRILASDTGAEVESSATDGETAGSPAGGTPPPAAGEDEPGTEDPASTSPAAPAGGDEPEDEPTGNEGTGDEPGDQGTDDEPAEEPVDESATRDEDESAASEETAEGDGGEPAPPVTAP